MDPVFLLLDWYPGENCTNAYKKKYLEILTSSPFRKTKTGNVYVRLERKNKWDHINRREYYM